MPKRRYSALAVLALAAAAVLLPASSASAGSATTPNACANSVTANFSQIGVTTSGDDGVNFATPGQALTTSLSQSAAIPGAIFVAGYNLGLLTVGVNNIPANVNTKIEGTNTTQGTQTSNTVGGTPPNGSVTVTTTITDPDGTPGTGDETATDASFSVTYNNMNWTAGAGPGFIDYRQESIATSPPTAANNTLLINALIAGFLNVQFRCAPGTVTPPDPGTITLIDPAGSFDTTYIDAFAPVANAGPDQMVNTNTLVTLDGSGSTDGDLPNDTLTYMWTQTGGANTVTLSDPTAVMPTFTSPSTNDILTFQLQVCDQVSQCSTDSVTITVQGVIIDKGGEVIVNGPVKAGQTAKTYVLRVDNHGTSTNTVDCATEIAPFSAVLVNGTANGSVSCLTASKTIGPGARARFRLRWSGDPLPAGATVEFTACVKEAGDIHPDDDCGSVTRTT